MAVGNTTQWGSRTGLDQIFAPGFEDAVYRNNDFLGLVANGTVLFPESPLTTGLDYRWRLNTAGNSSAAIFTEGAGAPQPVAQTYVNLTATPVYFWAWTRVTGHVRDAIRNGGAVNGLNPIANEFVAGFEDIKDLMNTTFMASTYGLTQIVDSGNTVFGVAQGSNAWHAASETAVGGALTLAGMTNLVETIRDNDKGGKPKAILTAHNQITNYIALMGVVAASNAAPRVSSPSLAAARSTSAPTPRRPPSRTSRWSASATSTTARWSGSISAPPASVRTGSSRPLATSRSAGLRWPVTTTSSSSRPLARWSATW